MKIPQLLTPITEVHWLAVTDTIRDAFDHMETYDMSAAPIVDWNGCYFGTVTEADLRRHVARVVDRTTALATPLSEVERRSSNVAVNVRFDVESIVEQATAHCFVPVVDDGGRLVGIVDRRSVVDTKWPSAA